MYDPDYIIRTASVFEVGQVKKPVFTHFLTALSVDTLYATTPSL